MYTHMYSIRIPLEQTQLILFFFFFKEQDNSRFVQFLWNKFTLLKTPFMCSLLFPKAFFFFFLALESKHSNILGGGVGVGRLLVCWLVLLTGLTWEEGLLFKELSLSNGRTVCLWGHFLDQ